MTIKTVVPWFGGKRTLAPRIVAELGTHSAYWEPFCGGMAVLLSKPESSHETVNDLHRDLINLARVVQDDELAPVLFGKLSRVLCDEMVRGESLQSLERVEDPLMRAYHYFIASWIGRNGFSGTKGCERSSFAVRWTPNGGHGGQRFRSAVESIPAWFNRLRRVTILSRDAFEVIEKIDDSPKVAIYIDPPYIDKNATYEHDLAAGDHARLAKMLERFGKARVVVSYYRHEKLADLYPSPQWTHIDCSMAKGLHNAGKRGSESAEAPEVLIVNGDSYAQPKPTAALFAG